MVECESRRHFRGGIAKIGRKAIWCCCWRSRLPPDQNLSQLGRGQRQRSEPRNDAKYARISRPPKLGAIRTWRPCHRRQARRYHGRTQKLTQNLIADRANARYTSEHLQAQTDEAATATTTRRRRRRPVAGAPPPAPAPNRTAGTPRGCNTAVAKSPAAQPGSNPARSSFGRGRRCWRTSGKGARNRGQPTSHPSRWNRACNRRRLRRCRSHSKTSPASPPPSELAVPVAPNPANPTAPGAHLPAPPPPAPMPAAIGSAQFEPAPPPPVLPPANPIRTATATGPGKAAKPAPPPAAFTQVAAIAFSGDTSSLTDADRDALGKLVSRYHTKPGLVRVVGYAGVASGAAQELNSYRTALDRAQAVANALTKAGIPANKIQVEAAPTGSDAGQGRAEILFEQ